MELDQLTEKANKSAQDVKHQVKIYLKKQEKRSSYSQKNKSLMDPGPINYLILNNKIGVRMR